MYLESTHTLLLLGFLSLVASFFICHRRARTRPRPLTARARLRLYTGPLYWCAGLIATILVATLAPLLPDTAWYVPRLVPTKYWQGWGHGLDWHESLTFAWYTTWFLGAPFAAALGVKLSLYCGTLLCSAAVVASHIAPLGGDVPVHAIVLAFALVHCLRFFSTFEPPRAFTSPHCLACGYDVSKTPNAPCPECGKPYAEITTAYEQRIVFTPIAIRFLIAWGVAAGLATISRPLGVFGASLGYLSKDIRFDTALQLALQYHGNTAAVFAESFLMLPLIIATAFAACIYVYRNDRRAWLLVLLGIAVYLALSFYV
jgi:hypothetical protein